MSRTDRAKNRPSSWKTTADSPKRTPESSNSTTDRQNNRLNRYYNSVASRMGFGYRLPSYFAHPTCHFLYTIGHHRLNTEFSFCCCFVLLGNVNAIRCAIGCCRQAHHSLTRNKHQTLWHGLITAIPLCCIEITGYILISNNWLNALLTACL